MIGDGLRARRPAGQGSEVVLGCAILNRMTALGRPVSYRLDREDPVGGHRAGQSRCVQQRHTEACRSSAHTPGGRCRSVVGELIEEL